MCYFFQKLKTKKREKNNLSRGKIPAPSGYQMVRPLTCCCYYGYAQNIIDVTYIRDYCHLN